MKNYNFIGNIDVSYYQNLFSHKNDWENIYTKRRNYEYEQHVNTSVIPILWSKDSLIANRNIVAPKTSFFDSYYNEEFFLELKKILNAFYNGEGYFVRILFSNLNPNSSILSHADSGESLLSNNRIHIPILTNNNVIVVVDNEEKNIQTGEIVEINNSAVHSVRNESSENRIHLIVDWNSNSS